MVRRGADVIDSLAFEYFLETGFTSPRCKLPAVIGENFSRCAPLADGAFDDFQN